MSKNIQKNDKRSRALNFSAQHLLIDKHLIKDLILLANITPSDTVLDIGAGTGAITIPLAKKAAHVLAIENDPAYVQILSNKTCEENNIRIKQIDFLKIHLPKGPFCVVANIPYSITTPILTKLLDHPTSVLLQRAALLIEKGAAKRFTAARITDPRILKWRMWFDIRLVRTVSPNHFSPPPNVDSAVLTVCRKKSPELPPHHHGRFMALASHGLRHPHLPFFEALADVFTPPQITKLVKMLRVERNQPICSLNERQWGELYLAMLQHVQPFRWPKLCSRKAKKNRRF